MIKSFIAKLKESQKAKRTTYILLVAILSLYIFSLPSFSGRAKLNLISYALMAISIAIVSFRYVLYEKFVFDKKLLIVLFFVIEALIGTSFHSHEFIHWLTIMLLFVTLVVFYYGFKVIDNKRLILKMIGFALLAFGAYFALKYRLIIIKFNLEEPIDKIFDNQNTLGTYFSLGSAIFLYLALTSNKKMEWLYLIPCFIMLFLGLFTGSRHFIITTGVAFVSAILISFKKKKWLAALIIIGVIILFFIIIQLPPLAPFKERIDRAISTLFGIGNAKYDPSSVQRTIWPLYGFSIGSKVLFFGYGAEGFSMYSGIGTYSHNTFSEIFCNFGLFGTLIFYSAFLYPLVLLIRSKDNTIKFGIIVILFYFAKSFFGVCFNSKDTYIMLALLFYLTKDSSLGSFVGFGTKRVFTTNTYYEVQI